MTKGMKMAIPKGDSAGDPKVRASAIGSSDAAVIMEANPWKTTWQLWREKAGKVEPERKESPAMEAGIRLEYAVLKWWADLHPAARVFTLRGGLPFEIGHEKLAMWNPLQRLLDTLRHPDSDRVMCHLDGLAAYHQNDEHLTEARFEIVEAKTGSGHGYGSPGSDEVPDYVWWQCQHQSMIVTAFMGGDPLPVNVALLRGSDGMSFDEFRIEPDLMAQAELEMEYERFWQSVDADEEPEPQTPEDVAAHHAARLDPAGGVIQCPGDLVTSMAEWKAVRTRKKKDAKLEATIKKAVMEAMGTAPKMRSAYGIVSWIERSAKKEINWEGLARALHPAAADEVGSLELLIEEYSRVRPGGRYIKYTPTRG